MDRYRLPTLWTPVLAVALSVIWFPAVIPLWLLGVAVAVAAVASYFHWKDQRRHPHA